MNMTLFLLILLPLSCQAALWQDSFLGYRFGNQFTEPNNPSDIQRHVMQFSHVRGYEYGQHFINLDLLRSDSNDPKKNSTNGSTEAYLTYRYQHYLPFATDKPLKRLAFTVGFDANEKNTLFAPSKRLLVLGPTIKFDVPGFWDISLFYAQEWNHCGLPACRLPDNKTDIRFDPQWFVNSAWKINFTQGGTPFKFQGFLNILGPRGRDYFGNNTATETLARTSVMADLSGVSALDRSQLWIGLGYEYWHNKFGNHDKPGVTTQTPTLQLEWHF